MTGTGLGMMGTGGMGLEVTGWVGMGFSVRTHADLYYQQM